MGERLWAETEGRDGGTETWGETEGTDGGERHRRGRGYRQREGQSGETQARDRGGRHTVGDRRRGQAEGERGGGGT